jgi:RimJ/RimL family protein N-acetyltransferase
MAYLRHVSSARVVLPERIEEEAGALVLRRWLPDDAPALGRAVAESAEHLRPWMAWIADEPLPVARRRAMIEKWGRDWADGGDVVLGAFLDGRIAGGCGLHRRIGPHGLEIGYWTHSAFLRRGLATRVAALLTEAALALPAVTHVEIHHDKANLASAGVPRTLAFQWLGEAADEPEAPGELGIECRWRMDGERWRRRRG